MRHAVRVFALASLAVWLTAPAPAAPLDQLRWQHRVVVLVGAGPEADRQRDQLLERPEELDERRILVLQVDREVRVLHGGTNASLPSAATLRKSLGREKPGSYEAVLIGLDGGVKWRSSEAVSAQTLFSVIDAMPMRRTATKAPRS